MTSSSETRPAMILMGSVVAIVTVPLKWPFASALKPCRRHARHRPLSKMNGWRGSRSPTLYVMDEPQHRIRALHTASTITVYQAYAPEIGLPAVHEGRFPAVWKRDRMTRVFKPRSQTLPRQWWHARDRSLGCGEALRSQSNATTKRTPSSPNRPARAFITAKTCGH
ncbi:DUF4291 family protein [Streptomyces sp. NBC_00631]|uniref:DUF4291 family protein n=1 Tax=Streptomyces sp. NBC_00631 TaxID=2975793 RepID=UPI003869E712